VEIDFDVATYTGAITQLAAGTLGITFMNWPSDETTFFCEMIIHASGSTAYRTPSITNTLTGTLAGGDVGVATLHTQYTAYNEYAFTLNSPLALSATRSISIKYTNLAI
jgi:hypothetical protein